MGHLVVIASKVYTSDFKIISVVENWPPRQVHGPDNVKLKVAGSHLENRFHWCGYTVLKELQRYRRTKFGTFANLTLFLRFGIVDGSVRTLHIDIKSSWTYQATSSCKAKCRSLIHHLDKWEQFEIHLVPSTTPLPPWLCKIRLIIRFRGFYDVWKGKIPHMHKIVLKAPLLDSLKTPHPSISSKRGRGVLPDPGSPPTNGCVGA